MSAKRCLCCLGLALLAFLEASQTGPIVAQQKAPDPVAQQQVDLDLEKEKLNEREYERLLRALGNNSVRVTLENKETLDGKLAGIADFFGKRFLILRSITQDNVLIRSDLIASISTRGN